MGGDRRRKKKFQVDVKPAGSVRKGGKSHNGGGEGGPLRLLGP